MEKSKLKLYLGPIATQLPKQSLTNHNKVDEDAEKCDAFHMTDGNVIQIITPVAQKN